MSMTINVEWHIRERLEIKANRMGQSLEDYVGRVVERHAMLIADLNDDEEMPDNERKADIARKMSLINEFVGTACNYSKDAPALADHAASREGIYEGQGE